MKKFIHTVLIILTIICLADTASTKELADIKRDGVLRHLGVPYAGFISGDGDGLSVELMQMFTRDLGIKYEYVPTTWATVINDLVGETVVPDGENIRIEGSAPVRGDIIANGLTILPWRQKVVNFSAPTFPTQVWLIADAASPIKPIKPSGSTEQDIRNTKNLLAGRSVLGKANTCLDPDLYDLHLNNAVLFDFSGNLNELAPAVINGDAETALLDVPDALIALAKWPGQIKVIGPVSPPQYMAVAFPKNTPELQKAFADFYDRIKKDGTYLELVKKYYPDVFAYYPEFFSTPAN